MTIKISFYHFRKLWRMKSAMEDLVTATTQTAQVLENFSKAFEHGLSADLQDKMKAAKMIPPENSAKQDPE